MKYQNTKTGFVFETKSEVKAEGWVLLDPRPTIAEDKKPEPKPRKKKVEK